MTPLPALDGCPIFDRLVAEVGIADPVDTEYDVLVAQALMDLLAGRSR